VSRPCGRNCLGTLWAPFNAAAAAGFLMGPGPPGLLPCCSACGEFADRIGHRLDRRLNLNGRHPFPTDRTVPRGSGLLKASRNVGARRRIEPEFVVGGAAGAAPGPRLMLVRSSAPKEVLEHTAIEQVGRYRRREPPGPQVETGTWNPAGCYGCELKQILRRWPRPGSNLLANARRAGSSRALKVR